MLIRYVEFFYIPSMSRIWSAMSSITMFTVVFIIFPVCPGYYRPCQASPSSRWFFLYSLHVQDIVGHVKLHHLHGGNGRQVRHQLHQHHRRSRYGFFAFYLFRFFFAFLRFSFLHFDSFFVDVRKCHENKIEIKIKENENRLIFYKNCD